MGRISIAFLFITSILLYSCNGNQKLLSKGDFGSDWPFTVSSGSVECIEDTYMVIFVSGGKTYALNDAARESGEFEDIKIILKADTNYYGKSVLMDTSPIEFEALKLCNRRR